MLDLEKFSISILELFPAEFARDVSHKLTEWGIFPFTSTKTGQQNLKTQLGNISLENPLGIPAGLDKNGSSIKGLFKTGISFLEVGTVTPYPQPGNERPRLFRISSSHELVNRLGLNNEGAEVIQKKLKKWSHGGVIGLSMGHNKTSKDPIQDFLHVLTKCGSFADYLALNISCPNINVHFDLSEPANLSLLLTKLATRQKDLNLQKPVFLKLSPDYEHERLEEIVSVSIEEGVDGFIATNSTTSRPNSNNPTYKEEGGLTGPFLFESSTRTLAHVYAQTKGNVPIIGVGGITTPENAYTKIKAGASALQIYTALCYQGTGLIKEICEGVSLSLQQDGFSNISEAVGIEYPQWLA